MFLTEEQKFLLSEFSVLIFNKQVWLNFSELDLHYVIDNAFQICIRVFQQMKKFQEVLGSFSSSGSPNLINHLWFYDAVQLLWFVENCITWLRV